MDSVEGLGSTTTWSQRHVAPAFQEIKATLPADPTLKIQIVRFLVETNLAPELLDTMSSPQTMERSRWFWMLTRMISWNSILFYVCSSRCLKNETMRLLMNRAFFQKILVVTTKDHHIHLVRSFGTAMLPWQTSRWHITSWKSPRTSAVEKAVVGVKLYGHSRFDNQVSSVYVFKSFPRRKVAWQWKILRLKMYFLSNMGIFQCHVGFQGCTPLEANKLSTNLTKLSCCFLIQLRW